jgi:hypothetical protein
MKKRLLSLVLLIAAFPAFAEINPIVGAFGHDFTTTKNDPVFTVKENKGSFQLTQHGDDSMHTLSALSNAAKKEFWDKMWWESNSFEKAQCLGNQEVIMCFVPKAERQKEAGLKDRQSDYFYYSPIAGVMEIAKIQD